MATEHTSRPASVKKRARIKAPPSEKIFDSGLPLTFPPYGQLSADLAAAAQTGPSPSGFTETTWELFRRQALSEIADVLWPQFDGGVWVGRATATADLLTRTDLALITTTFRKILAQQAGTIGDLSMVTHKALFKAEDDMPVSGGLFETVRRYLGANPPAVVNSTIAAAQRGLGALGPRPLSFKQSLQRPRPYQTSLLLGQAYSYEEAKSAATPSMMSGHCLQGLFVATWAYVDQRQQIDAILGARPALQRFGVDFGDRRVFAGVHYPSDNLASWYICLRLSKTCFGQNSSAALAFMSDAIKLSSVYLAMREAAALSTSSPYAPLMRWIDAALE